jgi:glutathione S-transferase
MSLTLYYHPFSSYCWKALLALHENGTAFTPRTINLFDEKEAAELKALWPIGKFPVLKDDKRHHVLPESTIIIEYLDQHYPGKAPLIPKDADKAREVRMWDRFFDFYIMDQGSKSVADVFPIFGNPAAVDEAKKRLAAAYGMVERAMAKKTWVTGETFTMADIAASPALFYADLFVPIPHDHKNTMAYLDRLMRRPVMTRVLKDALAVVPPFPWEKAFRDSVKRLGLE